MLRGDEHVKSTETSRRGPSILRVKTHVDPGSEEGPFRASQERQSTEPGQAVEEHARAEKT